MSKRFRFLSVLAFIASTACIITDGDDDDDAGDTSNSATANNTNNTTPASDSTASEAESSTAAGSSGAVDSSTGNPTGCGWGQLAGQDNVDEGYTCGGEGEDPQGVFPIACAEGVRLVEGGDCGGDMGVTGVGCCDGTTNWYCADNGAGPQLFIDACG